MMTLLVGSLIAVAASLIKFMDDARDEAQYSGRYLTVSWAIAVLCAVTSMYLSPDARLFWFAITAGCLLSGKLDTPEFKAAGAVILLASVLGRNEFWGNWQVLAWILVAFADELLNLLSDRMSSGTAKNLLNAKPLMPIVAACCVPTYGLGMISIVLFFDIPYAMTARRPNRTVALNAHSLDERECATAQGA